MTELMEDNMKKLEPEMLIEQGEIESLLVGINRCTDRLKRIIALKGPMVIVQNEVRMIQYRALSVLSRYEAFALLNFVYKEDKKE